MKRLFLIIAFLMVATSAQSASVIVENHSPHEIKISSIGGSARIPAGKSDTVSFKNDDNGATINIWWIRNARELCQIFTPWDRTITVSGKHTIQCLSKK